jgi:hypothetical protein
VANLRGLVSSLTIFGESLSASSVKTLYNKGILRSYVHVHS